MFFLPVRRLSREWLEVIAPENVTEIRGLDADAGRYSGYLHIVAQRRDDAALPEPIVSVPTQYTTRPLLRGPQ